MNYFVIGATVIVVGAGAYYIVKKLRDKVSPITPEMITLKEVEVIKLSCIGPWLKEQDVDSDDFGKMSRLFAFKDIKSDAKKIGLPMSILSKIDDSNNNNAIAFVLTDMDSNTQSILIAIGKSIDDNLMAILRQDVTEIHLK